VGKKWRFDDYSYLCKGLNLNELDPILQQLEANLYKGETHKINKKAIITLIQSVGNNILIYY
jgi:hypothetical protein